MEITTFECSGGHLVIIPKNAKQKCPECYVSPGSRWKHDPYVVHIATMLYEHGGLQGLNEVQALLLASVVIKKNQSKSSELREQFEQMLFVHRPEAWNELQRRREPKNKSWEDQVEWKAPETVEEAMEVSKMFEELAQQHGVDTDQELDEEDEWVSFGEFASGMSD